MNPVSSPDEIFAASKRVIDTLYGDVSDFKINETFQKPEKVLESHGMFKSNHDRWSEIYC